MTKPALSADPYRSAIDLAAATRNGETTARANVERSYQRVADIETGIHAVADINRERAYRDADGLDAELAAGMPPGPLHGVPVLVKAENDVAGYVTHHGSLAEDRVSTADADVVSALTDAGAVVIATATMSEFALWPYTETELYGYTRNPWNRERSTAGSSGGPAAAVAAGYAPIAIGGDSGGSIRLPAAWCGLFGLKAQRGRVSTGPNPDAIRALGTLGPLTRSVIDTAVTMDVLDMARRSTKSVQRFSAEPFPLPLAEAARRGSAATLGSDGSPRLRIGVCVTSPNPKVSPSPEVVAAVENTAARLRDLGHDVVTVKVGYPDLTAAHLPQVARGVRADMSRMRYLDRMDRRSSEFYKKTAMFDREGIARWAERRGEKIAARLLTVFDDVDLLITPTVFEQPHRIGGLTGTSMSQADKKINPLLSYTLPWNVAGNPAASIPVGLDADGLPLSVQLVARPHDEATIIEVGAQIETLTGWLGVRPAL